MSDRDLALFTLDSGRDYGEKVAAALGVELAEHEERSFEWGQHKTRTLESVRGRDVYVVQSLHGDPDLSANDKLCRLLPWDLELVREWRKLRDLRVSDQLRRLRKTRSNRLLLYGGAAAVLLAAGTWIVMWLGSQSSGLEGQTARPVIAAEDPAEYGPARDAAPSEWGTLGGDWDDPGAAGARRTVRLAGADFAFRWIPPGETVIGSTEDDACRDADETPWVSRLATGFWMAETEVTQAQWRAVMGERSKAEVSCPRCPVTRVDWYTAQQFIESVNAIVDARIFRLPYEAEWEYAARAGGPAPFGPACEGLDLTSCDLDALPCLDSIAWYRGNAETGAPKEVGLKAPNAWGLHDTYGNVAEWCQDRYGPYPGGTRVDYLGPEVGNRRVQRGGGLDDAIELRSTNRTGVAPNYDLGDDTGFRIVLGRPRS